MKYTEDNASERTQYKRKNKMRCVNVEIWTQKVEKMKNSGTCKNVSNRSSVIITIHKTIIQRTSSVSVCSDDGLNCHLLLLTVESRIFHRCIILLNKGCFSIIHTHFQGNMYIALSIHTHIHTCIYRFIQMYK